MNKKRSCDNEEVNRSSKYPKMEFNANLPHDVVSYLCGLAEHIQFENDEAKKLIAENFRVECEQYEASVLFCSPIGDSLITVCQYYPDLSIFCLDRLLREKRARIVEVFTNNFGSRCFEGLLYCAVDGSIFEKSITSVEELCQIAVDHFDRLSVDYSGCHVIRCVGRVLCGVRKDDRVLDNQKAIVAKAECRSILTNLTSLVLNWKYMSNNLNQENISMMVQDFLQLDSKYAKTNNVTQWIDNCLQSDKITIEHQLESKYGSRVWEKVILLCNEDDFERLFKEHFQSKLQQLGQHRFANFLVQRLLERCSDEEMLADLFDELLPGLTQFWLKKHYGLLVAMATAAVRTKFRQKTLLKSIRILIGCNTKSTVIHLVPCLLQFESFEEINKDDQGLPVLSQENMTLQGSLLIQQLFHFKKNKLIKNSLLKLNEDDLLSIACNKFGSRIIDLVFTSPKLTSGEDKLNLLNKLKVHVLKLSCDKVGSRVFESIFNNVEMEQKIQLGSLLLKKEAAVKSNIFGKILYSKYRLLMLKEKKKEWISLFDVNKKRN